MACMNKIIIFSPYYQSCRSISLSAWCLRRKPKPVRDPSKRNFQGEKLKEYMRKRAEAIEALQPYKNAVAEVIERFKIEVAEKEREKHDMQGEMMMRELAERDQAVKNRAILAKNNEDMRKQCALLNQMEDEEAKRMEAEAKELKRIEDEKIRKKNTALVLEIIEESKNFITFENMDEKIELVLQSEVNFNYAITPDGEKIHSTKPPGNLQGWKGPSPSAYIAGGIQVGSSAWELAFKGQDTGFELRSPLPRPPTVDKPVKNWMR